MLAKSDATPKQLKLTVIVDNISERKDLVGESGLSVLLETDLGTLLFDLGRSEDAVAKNVEALGIDLSKVDAIAVSHGHNDHTGGLAAVLGAAPRATLYLHPRTTVIRATKKKGFKKPAGITQANLDAIESHGAVLVTEVTLPAEGLMLSGKVPGPESPTQKGYLIEVDGERTPDEFTDEMFVLADLPGGVVLISGCCHRGLVNTLAHARALLDDKPIKTVFGGLHLGNLSEPELDSCIAALNSAGTEHLIAGHCTGKKAIAYLAEKASFQVGGFHSGFTREWT